MQRVAKVFKTNRSQAVRLPKDFQLQTDEVFIRKEGQDIVLSPRSRSWADYLGSSRVATPDYMDNVEELPVQEREL